MQTSQVVMLPVEAIYIGPNRQRQGGDAVEAHINSLSEDIARDGLLHAVAVDKNNELVSGWCRLNAIKKLQSPYMYASAQVLPGFVPAVVLHHVDERVLFRVELMENLRRKNLSPIDEAKATAALHRMFLEQAQEENPGEPNPWPEAKTGQELDKLRGASRHPVAAKQEVSEALLIESFADDADVAKASSHNEAVKIVKKKLEQQLMQSIGSIRGNSSGDMIVHHADCIEWLKGFEANSFQGIVVDPPYGIDAQNFGEQTMVGGHNYEDDAETAFNIAEATFYYGHRITKKDAHLYMFCDISAFPGLVLMGEAFGWQVFASPLIWYKPNIGHAPEPGFFGRRYECILFARKGNRTLAKSRGDVFEFPALKTKVHAAQKPVELIKELLSLSFFPGETILDPCAGSGTIFSAAHMLKMKAVGVEKDEGNYNLCKQLIGELK